MQLLLFISLVFASGFCSILAWIYDQKAELVVEPVEIDIGDCDQGTSQELTFRLTNRTWDDIEVLEIVKSCGCMENNISNPLLSRGDIAELKVIWQVGQHRGKRHLPIFVRLRDKTQNQDLILTLHATATVRAEIEFDVDQLNFDIHKVSTQSFRVSDRSGRYELVAAGTTHSSLAANWDSSSKTVSVTFDPAKLSGHSGVGYVVLETTNPNEPQVKIPVLIR